MACIRDRCLQRSRAAMEPPPIAPQPHSEHASQMAKDIRQTLQQFLRIEGVRAAVLVGRDGFVLGSATLDELDPEGIGATVASAVGSSEMMGRDLELGRIELQLFEFEHGRVMLALAGTGMLVLVAGQNALVGSMRLAVRDGMRAINALLNH